MTIEFDGQNNKITRDTAGSIKVDRKTSDGDIIELQKDGTTVGSIGVASSDLNIYGDVGIKFSGDDVRPTDSSGSNSDNAVDLGHFDVRWQDLYLGGNIYLGGTTSANALDDYEEGTWTPTAEFSGTNPTAGASTGTGSYTKVGDMVTLWGTVVNINVTGATGDLQITGLPFTSTLNTNLVEYAGSIRLGAVDFDTGYCTVSIPDGLSYIRVAENIDTLTSDFLAAGNCNDGSSDFFFNITYKTDS